MGQAEIAELLIRLQVELNAAKFKSIMKNFGNFRKLADKIGVSQAKLRGAFDKLGVAVRKAGDGSTKYFDKTVKGWGKANKGLMSYKKTFDKTMGKIDTVLGTGKAAKKAFATEDPTLFKGDIVAEGARRFGRSIKGVEEGLRRQNWEIKEGTGNLEGYQSILNKDTNQIMKFDQAMGGLGGSMRRFKMENLSIMFFGMQLQRTFGGMVKRITDLIGINEIWGATLQTILLPILLPLLDVFTWMLDFFNEHPTVAKMVGYFIAFAAALGSIMFYKAQLNLFLDSMKNLFGEKWVLTAVKKGFKIIDDTVRGLWILIKSIWDPKTKELLLKTIASIKDNATKVIKSINKNLKALPKSLQIMILIGAAWVGIKLGNLLYEALNLDNLAAKTREFLDRHPLIDKILRFVLFPAIKVSELAARLGMFGPEKVTKTGETGVTWRPPPMQFGGIIPQTGLYMMHKGEDVISPTGIGGGATSATFNINVSGGGNARQIADEVMRTIRPEFERIAGTRRI